MSRHKDEKIWVWGKLSVHKYWLLLGNPGQCREGDDTQREPVGAGEDHRVGKDPGGVQGYGGDADGEGWEGWSGWDGEE